MDARIFTLSQLMDARRTWVAENEPRITAEVQDAIYDGIIDAFVRRGMSFYTHLAPASIYDLPNHERTGKQIVEKLKVLFPDLVINYLTADNLPRRDKFLVTTR